MKLYCLSDNPNKPCFILKFKSSTIMLDCGLDMTSLLYFLPLPLVNSGRFSKLPKWNPTNNKDASSKLPEELKECSGQIFIDGVPEFIVPEMNMIDFGEIDVILLSNYQCMMGLPYITEYTNFKGAVYATEPTLQIARQYMEELTEFIERMPKLARASSWKEPENSRFLPPHLKEVINPKSWRTFYSKHDVESALSKVQMVSFNEKRDVFGTLKVMATSSGFCLGSSNWIIQSDYEKIAYTSGSSTLTTHPRPMEQAALRNSDILIMCALTQTPVANPDAMIGEFCVNAAMTLRNGGNVLVPCYASGVTYDLFECLLGHLDSCGLSQVPLYFISPVADTSLAYSNIFAEWLSAGKMSKVYLPEPPFPHAELVKNLRLRHYPNLHEGFTQDFRSPCLVFTGHPSLRLGDAVHFMELWGKNSSNTVIFTEPDFPYIQALAPYQPLAMKVCYCPIDTSLSFSQANKLIRDLKPLHLVIPEQYTAPPILMPNRLNLMIESDPPALPYRRGRVLTLPLRRRYEKIQIDPEFANSLNPTELKPGIAVTTITGVLVSKDNKHMLKSLQKDGNVPKRRKLNGADSIQKQYMWGSLDVREFVENLAKQGITDVKVEDMAGGHIVHLQSEDTLIQIEQGSTHIICGDNEPLRIQLRDTLLKCLSKF